MTTPMVDVVKSTSTQGISRFDPQSYPVDSVDDRAATDNMRDQVNRSRKKYTPAQTHHLKNYFSQSPTLDPHRKEEISKRTGLEGHQVKRWFQNRRHMEQKTHRRLAFSPQGVLPPVAPANHAMTMDSNALERYDVLPSTSEAGGYDDPWIIGDSFAADHEYWSQLFDVWLPSGVVPDPWDPSTASEPQDRIQHQPSDYQSDEEKLLNSNKSFSPPSSHTDIYPLPDVGAEQTSTPNHTIDTPPDLQNFPVHCEMCDRTFTRHQDLKRHLKTDPAHSKETPTEIWECFYCRFQSRRADAWKRHLTNVHASEVCLLRVLPDGTMVERRGKPKKRLLAIGSEPWLEYEKMYHGRHFRVKRY